MKFKVRLEDLILARQMTGRSYISPLENYKIGIDKGISNNSIFNDVVGMVVDTLKKYRFDEKLLQLSTSKIL